MEPLFDELAQRVVVATPIDVDLIQRRGRHRRHAFVGVAALAIVSVCAGIGLGAVEIAQRADSGVTTVADSPEAESVCAPEDERRGLCPIDAQGQMLWDEFADAFPVDLQIVRLTQSGGTDKPEQDFYQFEVNVLQEGEPTQGVVVMIKETATASGPPKVTCRVASGDASTESSPICGLDNSLRLLVSGAGTEFEMWLFELQDGSLPAGLARDFLTAAETLAGGSTGSTSPD